MKTRATRLAAPLLIALLGGAVLAAPAATSAEEVAEIIDYQIVDTYNRWGVRPANVDAPTVVRRNGSIEAVVADPQRLAAVGLPGTVAGDRAVLTWLGGERHRIRHVASRRQVEVTAPAKR